jgi:hypothetical protein
MTQLRHKGCGGNLVLDVSGAVALLTPSFNFGVDSVGVGVVELSKRNNSVPIGKLFMCSKCSNPVKTLEIEGQCIVCRKHHSPSRLNVTNAVPLICDDCFAALGENPPEKISTKASEYRTFVIFVNSTVKKSLAAILAENLQV